MIRTYFLPVETIDGVEQVAGIGQIHDAVLLCSEQSDIRKLIQDTTLLEHTTLAYLSTEWREPTQEEIDLFNARRVPPEPSPDTLRAQELLANLPASITQPEMWELMRIFGRRLGYDF